MKTKTIHLHQSFISFKQYRYALIASFLSVVALLAYLFDKPTQPANGGTWLGYTLGTLAALIIVFLMLFGIRKRSYRSSLGSTVGWLSAHIYFGLALVVLATLHCGLQFGWNIHTLTYCLMLLVVLSGCWGAYTYMKYPGLILIQRRDLSREELFRHIHELDTRALRLGINLENHTRNLLSDAIHRTTVGGNIWDQLSARDGSKIMLSNASEMNSATALTDNKDQHALIEILADKQADSSNNIEIACLHDLLEITGQKAALLQKIRKEIQLQGLLQFWIYFHLPLSFALLVSLVAHIVSVFLYW